MYREEILDMAMDILDNTDATLEEAMGIAIESAENKMSDAEKYRRRRLKAEGAAIAAARPGKYEGLSREARYMHKDKNGELQYEKGPNPRVSAAYSNRQSDRIRHLAGYQNRGAVDRYKADKKYEYMPRSYSGMTSKQKYAIDKSIDKGLRKEDDKTVKSRSEYVKKHPTYSKFDRYNGDTYKYREVKASKEAAIMDTALDFLDMYDVSLEEAIDMAYDYLVD